MAKVKKKDIIKVKTLPKEMLKTKNRKIMWKNTQKLLKKLDKTFPITNVYVCGSFITKKKWPNDVDLILLLKLKEKKKEIWSADVEFVSNGKQCSQILKSINSYMKKRYGPKHTKIYELERK